MENIKLEYIPRKKEEIKKQIEALEIKPKLVIIKVGYIEASTRYVRNKLKDCAEVNLPAELIQLEDTISEQELLDLVIKLNNDSETTALIVQLPLPKHISEQKIIEAINPLKDADGFSPLNHYCTAATPAGIFTYLEDQKYDFDGKSCVILGRSNIVGKPAHKLAVAKNMNAIMLHTHTSEEDKKFYLEHADLIIVATGHRHTLSEKYNLKSTAVVFDVGINFDEDNKICGDCDYESLVNKVAYISPVPNGCGLTTRLQLIENTLNLYKIQKDLLN